MTSKCHKVSVHSFLVERHYLWKDARSRDVFIWRFWHTSVTIGVLLVVLLLWCISLAVVAFRW